MWVFYNSNSNWNDLWIPQELLSSGTSFLCLKFIEYSRTSKISLFLILTMQDILRHYLCPLFTIFLSLKISKSELINYYRQISSTSNLSNLKMSWLFLSRKRRFVLLKKYIMSGVLSADSEKWVTFSTPLGTPFDEQTSVLEFFISIESSQSKHLKVSA